ncbi:MAG: hypothetical protein M1401_19345 [Chloroflexi bacterium]|nr:hypothetical protein [Bacteroidota bacterium]MCL5110977.1 hypothetical protein [Chloroflexota bacterium]
MDSQSRDWRAELAKWSTHNDKVMSDELQRLRDSFVQKFPIDRLSELTLDQYAIGKTDSFCYWLEHETVELGSIRGGSSAKFGVWWSSGGGTWRWNKWYQSPEDALTRIKQGLLALISEVQAGNFDRLDALGSSKLGQNRYSLRSKPLYLYFPEEFLPINNPAHLSHFLTCFGEKPTGDFHSQNRQLLRFLRSQPEFADFDTKQMEKFLYDRMPPLGRVWKVAPGESAKIWPMCRDKGCIAIGWLENVDYSTFVDTAALRQALQAAGQGVGGASSIWPFVNSIERDHIVVANKGKDEVVGVGIIVSDYIPAGEADNPSTDAHYAHSRRVDWRIKQSVKVPFQFAQSTVTTLSIEQWNQVRNAYLSVPIRTWMTKSVP